MMLSYKVIVPMSTPWRLTEKGKVCQDPGKISDQSEGRDLPEIPHEIDLDQAHGCHSRCGTYDEDAAARAGTIGQARPKGTVRHELCQTIHALGGCHERDVVYHSGCQTDDHHFDMGTAQCMIEKACKLAENSG